MEVAHSLHTSKAVRWQPCLLNACSVLIVCGGKYSEQAGGGGCTQLTHVKRIAMTALPAQCLKCHVQRGVWGECEIGRWWKVHTACTRQVHCHDSPASMIHGQALVTVSCSSLHGWMDGWSLLQSTGRQKWH